MGQGFFHIDVFAQLHGSHGRHGVHVVRSSHRNGVNVFFFVQHFPEVFVPGGLVVALVGIGRAAVVHITESYNVLAFQGTEYRSAPPPYADAGDVHLIAWRCVTPAQYIAGHNHEAGGGQGGLLDEFPATGSLFAMWVI